MVHKVDPRNDMDEELRISGVSSRHALHVRRELRLAVQWLPFLDLGHHLLHIHINLP